MAKKYVVRVSDTVPVAVKGSIKNETGGEQAFALTLTCKRLPQNELREDVKDGTRPAGEVVTKVAVGWQGQDLVLDPDTNQPAEFNADSLEALMNIPGVSMLCFQKYLQEVGAKEKNS